MKQLSWPVAGVWISLLGSRKPRESLNRGVMDPGQSVQPWPHPLFLPTSGECPGQKSGPAHPGLCSDNLPKGEADCLEGNGAEGGRQWPR